MTLHRFLLVTHRWVGLVAALVLVVVGISAVPLAFRGQIDHALNRSTLFVEPGEARLSPGAVAERVLEVNPGARVVSVRIAPAPDRSDEVALAGARWVFVDPYRGAILGERRGARGALVGLADAHVSLMLGRGGAWIVLLATVAGLYLALGGVILWWPRKIWRVTRTRSWRGVNFDLHNALGIASALIVAVLCLTGIYIFFADRANPIVHRLVDGPSAPIPPRASVPRPGVPPIGIDSALRIAAARLPDAAPTTVVLPATPTETMRVLVRFPGEPDDGGNRVVIDQYSGAVIAVDHGQGQTRGQRLTRVPGGLHTGNSFGLPWRVVIVVATVILVFQSVSGPLIWWKWTKYSGRATRDERRRDGAT